MTLRGFLRTAVIKALSAGPKSGYALMKSIQEFSGHKPSAGSMYPLLDQLLEEGLVSCKEKGRSKVYSLTQQGRKTLTEFEETHSKCIGEFVARAKIIEAVTGEDMQTHMAFIKKVQEGQFKEITPEIFKLKSELFKLLNSGELKEKFGKVKKILSRTIKELKAI